MIQACHHCDTVINTGVDVNRRRQYVSDGSTNRLLSLVSPADSEYEEFVRTLPTSFNTTVDLAVEEILRRRMDFLGWNLEERRVIRVAEGTRIRFFECDALVRFGSILAVVEAKNQPSVLSTQKGMRQLTVRERLLLEMGFASVETALITVGHTRHACTRRTGGGRRFLRVSKESVDAWSAEYGPALPRRWSDLSVRFFNQAIRGAA